MSGPEEVVALIEKAELSLMRPCQEMRMMKCGIASALAATAPQKMFMQTIKDKEAACPKLGLSRVVRAGWVALSQRLPSRLARR
jgi:hypothetical protein